MRKKIWIFDSSVTKSITHLQNNAFNALLHSQMSATILIFKFKYSIVCQSELFASPFWWIALILTCLSDQWRATTTIDPIVSAQIAAVILIVIPKITTKSSEWTRKFFEYFGKDKHENNVTIYLQIIFFLKGNANSVCPVWLRNRYRQHSVQHKAKKNHCTSNEFQCWLKESVDWMISIFDDNKMSEISPKFVIRFEMVFTKYSSFKNKTKAIMI